MRYLDDMINIEINRIIVVKLTKLSSQESRKNLDVAIELKNNRKHNIQIVCKYNIE